MAMCASRICCYWFLRFSVHFFIGIVTAFLCKRKIKKRFGVKRSHANSTAKGRQMEEKKILSMKQWRQDERGVFFFVSL